MSGARSRVRLGIALSLLLAIPAYLLAPPWAGLAVHVLGLAAGWALGTWMARRKAARYEESMKRTWTQWMRFSAAGESIAEIHRKVRGVSGRNLPILYAGLITLVWGLELVLVVLAFLQGPQATLALPFVAATAILAGAIVGHAMSRGAWLGQLRVSVEDLVRSGEVGLWGVV